MNWKFWQRKPKADDFGPVIKWYTPKPDDEQSAEEYVKPLLVDEPATNALEPVPTTAVEPDTALTGVIVPRMNPEIKARWLAALRSGDYKQGTCVLKQRRPHQKTEFCCLGVLCEIAVQDGVIEPSEKYRDDHVYEYEGKITLPPQAVADWAGMETGNPTVKGVPGVDDGISLAGLNDSEKFDFAAIADVIEAQL